MPVIPVLDADRNFYPENPNGTDVRATLFGHDAAALSQMGGEIGDFGSKLMTVRKRATENDEVSQGTSDYIRWRAETAQQTRLSYTKKDENGKTIIGPDGEAVYDVTGYATEMKQKTDAYRAGLAKNMSTGDAQRGFMDATNRYAAENFADDTHWEGITKALTYKNNFQIRDNSDANYLVNQQDPVAALKYTNDTLETTRKSLNDTIGNLNTAEEAQSMFHDSLRTRMHALFIGLGNNPQSARVGLNILNSITETAPRDYKTGAYLTNSAAGPEQQYPEAGKIISENIDEKGNTRTVLSAGGMSRPIMDTGLDAHLVQQGLGAEEIGNIRKRLEGVLKEDQHNQVAEMRGWVNSQHALLTSTNPEDYARYNPAAATTNLNLMKQLAHDGAMTKQEYNEALVTVNLGNAYNIVRNEFAMMPGSTKAQFDSRLNQEYDAQLRAFGIDDKTFGFEHKKQYDSLNNQVWSHFQGQRNKDIAAYVETYGKNPSGSIQGGVPDESRFRWRMEQANSLEHSGALFAKPEISSMVQDLKSQAETSPEGATARLENFKQRAGGFSGQAMQELIKKGNLPAYFQTAFEMDSPGAAQSIIQNQEPKAHKALEESVPKADKKLIDAAVLKEMGPAMQSITASGGLVPSEQLRQAVTLEAYRQKAENGFDNNRAAAAARESLIDSQYHILSNSSFMPKRIGSISTDPENVKAQMQSIYDSGTQARLGIQMPGTSSKYMDQSTLEGRRANAISSGRWITNPDNQGATFVVPVPTGKGMFWAKPVDKNGQPITIDFVSATMNPSKEALANKRAWWDFRGSNAFEGNTAYAGQAKDESGKDYAGVNPEDQQSSAEQLKMSQAQLDVVKNPQLVQSQQYDKASNTTTTTLKDGRHIKMKGKP